MYLLLAELRDRGDRGRRGDLLDGDRLKVYSVQEQRDGVRGRRHPVRVRLLPLRVRHGRHVLRHALRRLERASGNGEVSFRQGKNTLTD